jgi:hypothetical protein
VNRVFAQIALSRSGANSPAGGRYNRVYATLAYAWPQLAKLDKSVRSHAIWLFENYDLVKAYSQRCLRS